jgi:hypothetical protein
MSSTVSQNQSQSLNTSKNENNISSTVSPNQSQSLNTSKNDNNMSKTALPNQNQSLNTSKNDNNMSKTALPNQSLSQDIYKIPDKKKVIEFVKIIGSHEEKRNICSSEYIKELRNGFFVSAGTDSKLIVYNRDFSIHEEIITIKEWTYSICERIISKKKGLVQFIGCSNKELFLTEIDSQDEKCIKAQKYELPETTSNNCVEMRGNDYVIVGLNGGHFYTNLFEQGKHKVQNHVITDKTFKGVIKIGKDLAVMTSNSVSVNGEDSLIVYDCSGITKDTKEEKKIINNDGKKKDDKIKEIYKNKYSFILNNVGLALINFKENKNKNVNIINAQKENENEYFKDKILLCACKKYLSHQKNGILLVNIQNILGKDYKKVKHPFYDTGEFEVYCFCPLTIEEKKFTINKSKSEIQTEFFLVGGFDNGKCEGKIKLYKMLYNDDPTKVRIEYLQDIEFKKDREKKFLGFNGAISSIIQSEKYLNILATCYDGNDYLLSPPNLEYYLDEKNENNNKK